MICMDDPLIMMMSAAILVDVSLRIQVSRSLLAARGTVRPSGPTAQLVRSPQSRLQLPNPPTVALR
jgi:hypothetical protein